MPNSPVRLDRRVNRIWNKHMQLTFVRSPIARLYLQQKSRLGGDNITAMGLFEISNKLLSFNT